MKNLKKIAVVLLALVMVVTVFAACDIKLTPQQKILGAWRDSTGTMGYEFLENNACKITYADVTIPLIGQYNGTVDGTYTVSKNEDGSYLVSITFTILSRSLTRNYIFTVDGNALNLTNTEDGTITTLIAYTDPATQTSAAQ